MGQYFRISETTPSSYVAVDWRKEHEFLFEWYLIRNGYNVNNKSRTCVGHRGEPLTEYSSKHEATEGARYVRIRYGRNLNPYQCHSCRQWHLSPNGRHRPSRSCLTCSDSNGQPKELYSTETDAYRKAKIIREQRSVRLTIYKCPTNSGWHLSKAR